MERTLDPLSPSVNETPSRCGTTGETQPLESRFTLEEALLLKLLKNVEDLSSQVQVLKEEVRQLKEEREFLGFSRDIHDATRSSFRFLPEGQQVEVDGEVFRSHILLQAEQCMVVLARSSGLGCTGQLLMVRRGRLVSRETLGPLEERILAILVQRRDTGTAGGINAREIEKVLERESNVLPELPNAPVDSSIRSSVCRLRSKLARLAGPRGQVLTSDRGYRLKSPRVDAGCAS